MATIRVRSTDGNDADNGTTWALAKATLLGAAAIDVAGDTIVVSSVHNESAPSTFDFPWAGTAAAPTRILSVDDSADPPTALLPGATVSSTEDFGINLTGNNSAYYYINGFTFNCGGWDYGDISIGGNALLENCKLFITNTGTFSRVDLSGFRMLLKNCSFRFSGTEQGIGCLTSGSPKVISGGGIVAGGSNISSLVTSLGSGSNLLIEGFDLSLLAASVDITSSSSANSKLEVRNCTLPPSWTGSVSSVTPGSGVTCEMFSCWSGSTEIIWRRKTQFGEGRDETTLVRTGGGKHRGVGVSLKCDTTSNANYPLNTFDTLQFVDEVTAAQLGSSVTATVEILHDSATALTDADIWLTVSGPGSEVNSDQVTDVFATPANQASSSATWTTTGMANPNTQKLTVTWTPAKAGVVLGTVSIAAASKTVYVDNMMTVAP